METPVTPTPLHHRVREGLARVAAALRADDWSRAKSAAINPTQLAVLEHLEGRPEGAGVRDIAAYLGVSQPTATDSIAALERKGLVEKHANAHDKRAVLVRLTADGAASLRVGEQIPGTTDAAVAALPAERQEDLLLNLITLIRQLQDAGAIPVQRMCVSCRHFRPFAHADAATPHHCAFVDAAFGPRELRVDCREHEAGDPAFRAATWNAFERDPSPLQAKEDTR